MTNNITAAANIIAANIIAALPDDELMTLLQSDGGCPIVEPDRTWVAWYRADDDKLVVWAGNDIDPDMNAVIEVPVTKACPFSRFDYGTGERLGAATWAEYGASLAAAEDDGGRGVFAGADGRAVYVA